MTHIRIVANRFQKWDTIHFRHHDIRNYKIRLLFQNGLQTLFPVTANVYLVLRAQFRLQETKNLVVVIYDHNPIIRFMVSCLSRFFFTFLRKPQDRRDSWGSFVFRIHPFGFLQMIFPIRNMNNETTSLCILPITSIDSAVMQFNYHPAQIQSYTKTDTSIETIGRRLIKTFEYFSLFVDGNTNTGITNLQYQPIIFLFQCHSNALTAFRIFESIWK